MANKDNEVVVEGKRKGFSMNEKLQHYTGVAKGEISVKPDSKYTEAEQRAYARGQRDARNEARRVHRVNERRNRRKGGQ